MLSILNKYFCRDRINLWIMKDLNHSNLKLFNNGNRTSMLIAPSVQIHWNAPTRWFISPFPYFANLIISLQATSSSWITNLDCRSFFFVFLHRQDRKKMSLYPHAYTYGCNDNRAQWETSMVDNAQCTLTRYHVRVDDYGWLLKPECETFGTRRLKDTWFP